MFETRLRIIIISYHYSQTFISLIINSTILHAGGMYTEGGKFIFVGVGHMTYDRPYFDSYSITLYTSTDLGNWTLLSNSILNKISFINSTFSSPLIDSRGPVLLGRPKLIRSAATCKYILWVGFMSRGNGVCVASSATIAGEYEVEYCTLGNELIGDLTVVPDKGEHFLIADTAGHTYTGISRLGAAGLNIHNIARLLEGPLQRYVIMCHVASRHYEWGGTSILPRPEDWACISLELAPGWLAARPCHVIRIEAVIEPLIGGP